MAHPIAAIATGFVRSGIGILRMSGDGCIDLANKVFTLSSKKPMSELPVRLLSRGTLYDEQSRPIDEAMVFVSRAPHSYTGEDTVEFQCHGSPAVLRAGLSALLSVGFRQAGPGEFTKRAFLSGEVPATPVVETTLPLEPTPAMIEQPKRVFTVEQEEKLQAAMVQLEQQKAKRTKKTQQVENQLSLFDSVA